MGGQGAVSPLVEEFRSKIVLKNPSVLLVLVVKQSNLKMLWEGTRA